MAIQYIVNENAAPQAIVLPLAQWHKITADLEELEDIRAYDDATCHEQQAIDFAQALKEIEALSNK